MFELMDLGMMCEMRLRSKWATEMDPMFQVWISRRQLMFSNHKHEKVNRF